MIYCIQHETGHKDTQSVFDATPLEIELSILDGVEEVKTDVFETESSDQISKTRSNDIVHSPVLLVKLKIWIQVRRIQA